ncbi:MAG: ATP-dependent helicase HrpB [Pseudomonadales bacterium]|nr:ATP-dependent helicase HrpB [Pseudomonadales bacterium]
MTDIDTILPIADVLDDIQRHLSERHELVLQAPPGAGKTTVVPLVLMDQPWLNGQKILLLEPRRIAARNAAHRMADMLGEKPGGTVGYRMRLDTRVGPSTIIEVITEGVFTRMLQSDPSLEGTGLVIFDEFHERSLDSDLGLALALHGRALFRAEKAPLKILVMSATLDSQRIAELLADAPLVTSEGRQFPVAITYTGARQMRDRIVDRTISAVLQAIDESLESSVLVFLPGQGEISRVAERLAEKIQDANINIRRLYGNLSIEEQQLAIAPEPGGQRKIVLATNIAETSLTILGVDVVVDTGLAREPHFDPNTGMTRLKTVSISQSSSTQRAGRAGRLADGRCYRLWSESQQLELATHTTPEIRNADLSPLVLQLLHWGVSDPAELSWLETPPTGNWSQAKDLLAMLGALDANNAFTLTRHGQTMLELATHPRLSHMLLRAVGEKALFETATYLAAILSDRDPFTRETPDMSHRISALSGEINTQHRGWVYRTRELAKQFAKQLSCYSNTDTPALPATDYIAYLLACAYPDRVARKRHAGGYQLVNGRSANLTGPHSIGTARWLAVAETGGGAKSDVIYSGAPLNPQLFEGPLADLVDEVSHAQWDSKVNRFTAERQRRIGVLVLDRQTLEPDAEMKQSALIELVQQRGFDLLPWTNDCEQFRCRVMLLRVESKSTWPDLSDDYLLNHVEWWLGPYLGPITALNGFKKLNVLQILKSLITFEELSLLNKLAPERIKVPSGSNIKIDYGENPPVLAVKLQEMFGVVETPSIANGNIKLLVHLLSPAGRPLQVTQDLAGFWKGSYFDVKKEMKGRYPKHPWPDDPLIAIPTRKTR